MKFYIKTYGCQMNVYDSDRMSDLVNSIGYHQTDKPKDANIAIINTCHIREKASEKLYSDLGRLKIHKNNANENGKQFIIVVAGCVAQAEGEEIFKRMPIVDIIVGPESYQTLPDLIGRVIRDKSREIDLDFKPDNKFDILKETREKTKISSFLSIQEGCDKFCTFCVVPYTRGKEFSRPVEQIKREAINLANNGTKEIYLLGQNVNAYHGENKQGKIVDLAYLIEEIAKIDSIKRIRYTTSHPRDMSQNLINAHKNIDKLMPFLHLPVQSGSDKILKLMNRKHDRKLYFDIVEKLRKARPDIALSSDFIVGFPGEKERDFEDTINLIKEVEFSQCYSFIYSPRIGTTAADKTQIDKKIQLKRLKELQNLVSKQQMSFNKKFEGKITSVLFDRIASKNQNQIIGKTPWLQSVVIEDSNKEFLNKIVKVKIIKSRPSSLIGEIIK